MCLENQTAVFMSAGQLANIPRQEKSLSSFQIRFLFLVGYSKSREITTNLSDF